MRYQSNDKSVLRSRLETVRRGLSTADRERAGHGYVLICGDVPEIRAASVVCCYSAFGTEPPTGPLLDWLAGRGVRVLLPVLRPDLDLDWSEYTGPDGLSVARREPGEPVGPRLGTAAIEQADVVIAPGLAVDRSGVRLGRGGGSYDRALVRARPDAFLAVPLYDGELVDRLPHEPHDRRVHAALTPTGLHRIGG
ncbi:MAG: 5-formyltetrahydrofolate cyclo-ligase [Sporichthyaceae bacterium]|nr:5-formyltetrahydrofolate cyclo-ligase [Sporichthyaceae bacterium]